MITATTITGVGIIDSGVTLMARVRGHNGALITQASLTAITYTVRNLTLATTVTSAQSLTVSSVIFDSLQQGDTSWDVDSAAEPGRDGSWGYNFRATIPASHFGTFHVESITPYRVTNHEFQIDVLFDPVTGEDFRQPFRFKALATWP